MRGAIVGKRMQNGLAVVAIVVAAVAGSEATGAQAAGKRHVAPGEGMAADHPTTAEFAQATQTYEFNIPAKPLRAALANYTATTGVQVVRPDAKPLTGTSQPVSGPFTAAQALGRLLIGTGLSARFSGASTVTLERSGPPSGPGRRVAAVPSEGPRPPAGTVLPAEPVTVQEQRPPVTGYVATRSTVGTKLDLPLLDVPQSIQVVPRQVIDDQHDLTLSDVLRNVSGFSPG